LKIYELNFWQKCPLCPNATPVPLLTSAQFPFSVFILFIFSVILVRSIPQSLRWCLRGNSFAGSLQAHRDDPCGSFDASAPRSLTQQKTFL